MLGDFRAAVFRFCLRARETLHLPVYKGSTFRGGFGRVFRKVACIQRGKDCPSCLIRRSCVYTYVFETPPPADSRVLRNLSSIPRPFVIEPPLEEKTDYAPGEEIDFGLILFGRAVEMLPYFVLSFQELGSEGGLGKGRGRFDLLAVAAVNPYTGGECTVYTGDGSLAREAPVVTIADVSPRLEELRGESLVLDFLTPARLLQDKRVVMEPVFQAVFRSLLRRLSSIWYFHLGRELDVDYRGLIEHARGIRLVRNETRYYGWERFSHRQDRRVEMGGLVGRVAYEGELAEFLPFLVLGELTHVGKGAVFGLGKYGLKAL